MKFIRTDRDRCGDWIPDTTTPEADGQKTTVSVNVDAFASDA